MLKGRTVVFDVGKTLAKLSMWDAEGRLLANRARANQIQEASGRRNLDTAGIESWAAETLKDFGKSGDISAIVPVGHGAAAAIVRNGELACPVPDYEDSLPPDVRLEYFSLRDSFSDTGSPFLPDGLNLGSQLFRLEKQNPSILAEGSLIVTWPQYWAWRLCGVPATEVTSLGCHSDLWRPGHRRLSQLSISRGWSQRMAPIRKANDVLGKLTPEWQKRTGLGPDVDVLCGIHDSNASLLAARGHPALVRKEATILSTGTWFVAMRTPGPDVSVDLTALHENLDCLVNVDIHGHPIPSARFMGGREIEILGGIDNSADPAQAIGAVVDSNIYVLPGWVSGVGPFPTSTGRWISEPHNESLRQAAVGVYAALMVSSAIELIGTQKRLLIEGRFAQARTFVATLATLRPDLEILVDPGNEYGIAFGALRLVDPNIAPSGELQRVASTGINLDGYRTRWRRAALEGSPA